MSTVVTDSDKKKLCQKTPGNIRLKIMMQLIIKHCYCSVAMLHSLKKSIQ